MNRITSILPVLIFSVAGYQLQAQSNVKEKVDSIILASISAKSSPMIIEYSPYGKYLAAINYAGAFNSMAVITLYDASNKQVSKSSAFENIYLQNNIQFLASGQLAVSNNKSIYIFKLPDLKTPVRVLKIPSSSYAISPDEKHIITILDDKDDKQVVSDYSFTTGLLGAKANVSNGFAGSKIVFGYDRDSKEMSAYVAAMDKESGVGFFKIDFKLRPIKINFIKPDNYTSNFPGGIAIDTSGGIPTIYFGFTSYITRFNFGVGFFDMKLDKTSYPDENDSGDKICDLALSHDGQFLAASFASSHKVVIWKFVPDYQVKYVYYKTINTNHSDESPISISPDSKRIATCGNNSLTIYNLE